MRFSHVLSATLLAVAPSFAGAAQLSSEFFTNKYEADVLPTADGFTETVAPASGGSVSVNSGILEIITTVGSPEYKANVWAPDSAIGYTIEFRAKVVIPPDVTEGANGPFLVKFGDAVAGDGFSVGSNFAVAGNGSGSTILYGTSNTDDFHTFRITVIQDDGRATHPLINYYRDGELVSSLPDGGNLAPNLLAFGAYGTGFNTPYIGNGTVLLDYFRWDTTGAYEPAPVPEPTAVSLVGGAALLLIQRRRRNG